MTNIKIYTKDYCPYCTRAKGLLNSLGVDYEEIDITHTPEVMAEISEKSGFLTVPQIFVGEKCLGGCDELFALHEEGKLMKALNIE